MTAKKKRLAELLGLLKACYYPDGYNGYNLSAICQIEPGWQAWAGGSGGDFDFLSIPFAHLQQQGRDQRGFSSIG